MLIPFMDISRLMVHAGKIEEKKPKQVSRELKRSKPMREISPKLGLI